MIYTVSEMAKKLNIPPSTLRFYDKEGLLPFLEHSKNGIRLFKESDYEWLKIIECLKKTGMQLKDIKHFLEMAIEGDTTIALRLELIKKQKQTVKQKMEELNATLQVLEYKEWYYTEAEKTGSTEIVKNIPTEQLPENFKLIKQALQGK